VKHDKIAISPVARKKRPHKGHSEAASVGKAVHRDGSASFAEKSCLAVSFLKAEKLDRL